MNTLVPYKRPSCRNKYGSYESLTWFSKDFEFNVKVRICLVWFNYSGWYYVIQLEGWRFGGKGFVYEHRRSAFDTVWIKGKDLSLCAESAEQAAKKLGEENGFLFTSFNPYELTRKW